MPLAAKIDRIVVSLLDAEFAIVTGDAFRRAANETGLRVYSMKEASRAQASDPAAAGASAVIAGYDLLIDVADGDAAFWAIASAVDRGELTLDRIDSAVARLLLTMRAAGTPVTTRD